jgi:hypothetical protein
MSRHGYVDEGCLDELWHYYLYRHSAKQALEGKRGQKFLRDLLGALDALPEKRLVQTAFIRADGEVCVIGALAKQRNIDTSGWYDPDNDYDSYDFGETPVSAVSQHFNIARALARDVMYENDEGNYNETDEQRFDRMRKWLVENIKDYHE